MIRILGDRVLVLLPNEPSDTVTASGIILTRDPDAAKLPTHGLVLQLGEKSNTCDLDEARSVVHTYFVESAELPAFGRELGDAIDRLLMRLEPAPFDVAVGDCVLFPTGAGEEFHQDGLTYVVLREVDIIGIVQPKKAVA